MKSLTLVALLILLAGCASSPPTPQTREIESANASSEVLSASLEVLTQRGFVIQFADLELGRIDAVLAARPGYRVRVETRSASQGTQLILSGRQGRRAIEPQRFDRLLVEITARLDEQ